MPGASSRRRRWRRGGRHLRWHVQPDPSADTCVLADAFRERLGPRPRPVRPGGPPPHKPPDGARRRAPPLRDGEPGRGGPSGLRRLPIEVAPGRPSYSVDTVEALAGDWPGARLFFLMGSDTFLDLPTWRRRSASAPSATLGSRLPRRQHVRARRARRRARCSRGSAGRAGVACRRTRRRRWLPASARSSRRARSPSPRAGCAGASAPARAWRARSRRLWPRTSPITVSTASPSSVPGPPRRRLGCRRAPR